MKNLSLYAKRSLITVAVMCVALMHAGVDEGWRLPIALIAGVVAVAHGFLIVGFVRRERIWTKFMRGNGDADALSKLPPCTKGETEAMGILLDRLGVSAPPDVSAKLERNKYIALQRQINPHFLYNTLDIIRGKALMGEMESVSDMLEATGSFIGYSISNMDTLAILSEEIELVKTYVFLQKERLADRLEVNIENRADDQVMECRLPRMTLQPIVENAIQHAFSSMRTNRVVRIVIERCEPSLLNISVLDNGAGMDAQTLKRLNQSLIAVEDPQPEKRKGGIGLRNVSQRIKLLFGEQYGLSVYS